MQLNKCKEIPSAGVYLLRAEYFSSVGAWNKNHVHLSLSLYLSREKKQITREENHLMEDKKKKKQEEKKKKDSAQKKVGSWWALSFDRDIHSSFSFNYLCLPFNQNQHGKML